MEPTNNHLGKCIKQIMTNQKMKTADFAVAMGFSESRAYSLFKQQYVRGDVLIKAAKVLGVDPRTISPFFIPSSESDIADSRISELKNRNDQLSDENKELLRQNSSLTESVKELVKLLGKTRNKKFVLA